MSEVESKRILLVEDEAIIALATSATIASWGYEVAAALSGEQAVAMAAGSDRIDLVLMDIDLGRGLNGSEAASRILESRKVPIVFLTSHSERTMVEKVRGIARYGYVIKNSGDFVLRSSIEMAFELFEAHVGAESNAMIDASGGRERAEEATRRSSERFESLVRDIQVGVVLQGPGAEIILCNPKALELLGLSEDQILGKTSFDPDWNVIHEDGSPFPGRTHPVPAAIASRTPVKDVVMGVYSPARGDRVWLSVNAIPLLEPDGSVKHVVCSFTDITEQKAASSLILRTNTLLKAILESSPEVIVFALDRGYRYLAFNSRHEATMRQIWGKPIAVGMSMLEVIGDGGDRAAAKANFDRALEGESFAILEEWGDPRLSRLFWMDYWSPIRDEGGSVVGLTCFALNYTDQKLAEDRIKNLLAEKELILKEVHHRIKNNMNTLQSLLTLQSGTMKDSAAVTALEDARSRVQSMMVLYEKLYESASFDQASVRAYLPALVDRIVGNFPQAALVRATARADDFLLDARRLQPIGIIVNELVTNAMKHAFAGRDSGLLEVSATLDRGRVLLVVRDDGPGLPASVGFESSSGFGLTLVGILAEQLKASIRIDRAAGTKISLEFAFGD